MPQHLGEVLALVQQAIALAQLSDDLLRRVSVSLHRDVLHPSMLGVGLSRKVDHYPGSRQTCQRGEGRDDHVLLHWRSGRATELIGRAYEQCP